MKGISKIYDPSLPGFEGIYFMKDLAVRSPIWMAPPEPDPELLIRPVSRYSVYIGRTEYGSLFYWDPELYNNPLMILVGMPGAGKSHTVKTIIIRFKKKMMAQGRHIPVIVIDPEDEYKAVVHQLGVGVVLNLGDDDYINIFDRPYPTMSYRYWVRKAVIPGLIKALRISEAQAPMMMSLLEQMIFDVYEKVYKFKPQDPTTWVKEDPTLKDVVDYIGGELKRLEGVKGKAHVRRSLLALQQRLRMWTEGEGSDIFAHRSTVKLQDLMKQELVVFNIKKLPEDARNMITWYLFVYFYSLMENMDPLPRFGIRVMLVVDEGWILLKKERTQENPLEGMFRRARKYGFSAIVATQRPEDVASNILPHAGTVFILRVRSGSEVEKLKKSLGLSKRLASQIPALPQGAAIVAPAFRKTEGYANAKSAFKVYVEPEIEPYIRVRLDVPESQFKDVLKRLRAVASRAGVE